MAESNKLITLFQTRPAALCLWPNHSSADVQYNCTTESAELLLYNSSMV